MVESDRNIYKIKVEGLVGAAAALSDNRATKKDDVLIASRSLALLVEKVGGVGI